MFFFYEKNTLKNISDLNIDVELALNHVMVLAVLTERQTSDCDAKCRIFVPVEIACICAPIRVECQCDD